MRTLWIVHRDAARRASLAALARGIADPVRTGSPADESWDPHEGPAVVLLALPDRNPRDVAAVPDDLESEIEFARRQGPRCGDARWVLMRPEGLGAGRVEALFAGLAAEPWATSTAPAELRARLAAALVGPGLLPLRSRRRRDELERRAALRFGDLALPTTIATDRILIRGEPGTGRGLLARLLHERCADPREPFVSVVCSATSRFELERLEEQLASMAEQRRGAAAVTVCLEELDRAPPAAQRSLRARLESGDLLPEDLGVRRIRWIATAGEDDALDPDLAAWLGDLRLRLPPLRDRPDAIEPFVTATVRRWCAGRGRDPIAFSPEALASLRAGAWVGNFRELEDVVQQTLASKQGEPSAVEAASAPTEDRAASAPTVAVDALAASAPTVTVDSRTANGPQAVAPPADERSTAREAAPGRGEADPEFPGRLAGALAHAVRNPLVAIRTFAALLPERIDDPEFRDDFRQQVSEDVSQLEAVVQRLIGFAGFGTPTLDRVDVTGLLEALLEERRPEIQARRLLVLQELDATRPLALADASMLRFALDGLLNRALAQVPERADLFVASKHHPLGLPGGASVRILLRFFSPARGAESRDVTAQARSDVAERSASLEFVIAQQLVRAQGGVLQVDTTEADETVMLLDLPAPG